MYLEMSTSFMIYGPLYLWRVSISVHVEHRIPDAAPRCTTRTGLALSSLLYAADFSTSLQVPGEFQANSMMLLNSILFEIPRDVVWSEVRLCQAGVCKWETGDRSRGTGRILLLSCGLAPPRAFLPILSPAFILITSCIISCQLLTPANRNGCPQRPCSFCILFSI